MAPDGPLGREGEVDQGLQDLGYVVRRHGVRGGVLCGAQVLEKSRVRRIAPEGFGPCLEEGRFPDRIQGGVVLEVVRYAKNEIRDPHLLPEGTGESFDADGEGPACSPEDLL
jgi:hypothetical protein